MKARNPREIEPSDRARWHFRFLALVLGGSLLSVVPAHGQQIYWTDAFSKVKKLAINGTVETVVTDFDTPRGLAIDAQAGKMYWGSAEIERANLDGTDRELVVFNGLGQVMGVDIDPVNGKVYWADNQLNAVNRANLDGTGVEVVIPEFSVLDVAVDPVGGKVYWNANSFSLKRANLDGTDVEFVLENSPSIGSIDIDPVERKIYWTHNVFGNGFVRRANLDGSMVQNVIGGETFSGHQAIDLDILSGKVYCGFCGVNTPEGIRCAIQRANFDGTDGELVVITGVEASDAFSDIEVIPDPAELCDLELTYTSGTIELDFQLATSVPATWSVWLSLQSFTVPLWSFPLAVIDPPTAVNAPIPGFPPLGTIGFLTTLTRPGEGIICSDWETIDTGTPTAVPSARELKELFRKHVPGR